MLALLLGFPSFENATARTILDRWNRFHQNPKAELYRRLVRYKPFRYIGNNFNKVLLPKNKGTCVKQTPAKRLIIIVSSSKSYLENVRLKFFGGCHLLFIVKGKVRIINDRNICERRSCMKNYGKSPTLKFVSGEERRPSEVQRVSQGWRLPGAAHSSADPTWIWKWLEIQAPELSELESVELELGRCCSDLDKQVSDEICRTQKRQLEIPFRL